LILILVSAGPVLWSTSLSQGPCTYVLSRHVGGEFVVEAENVQCGYGGVTCTKAVGIFVNGTSVELVMGRPPTVDGRQLAAHQLADFRFNGGHLVYNGLNTVVFFEGGLNVVWDGGSYSLSLALIYLHQGRK